MQFCSPTINMFFYSDHFFTFCEHLDAYLNETLRVCEMPLHTPEINYPVCNLGDGVNVPIIELHFLHYKTFEQASSYWERRKIRIDKDNIFIIWTFFDKTDETWLKRFDALPFKNKVAFTERPFPQYKSAFCIHGYEECGLGVLSRFNSLSGHRIMDQFDFVGWFNSNYVIHE